MLSVVEDEYECKEACGPLQIKVSGLVVDCISKSELTRHSNWNNYKEVYV